LEKKIPFGEKYPSSRERLFEERKIHQREKKLIIKERKIHSKIERSF